MEHVEDFLVSCWIDASAGSGKTTKLINRIWQILLTRNAQKILCLTFTNAAAEEMQERLMNFIYKWHDCSFIELKKDIDFIFCSTSVSNDIIFLNTMIQKAKLLWSSNRNNDVEIKTIHSFCSNLLHDYAIDLGINPFFEIMSDIKSDILLRETFDEYIVNCDENIINYKKDDILLIVKDIISLCSTWDIDNLYNRTIDGLNKLFHVEQFIDIPQYDVYSEFIINVSKQSLIEKYYEKDLCKMPNIKNSEFLHKNYSKIEDWFIGDKVLLFAEYSKIFLKLDGKIRLKICKKEDPAYNWIMKEQNAVKELYDILIKFDDYVYGKNIINLLFKLLKKFQIKKQRLGFLSYSDLVTLTNYALNDFSGCDGIRYDISRKFDHVLVDEAQDNSLEQWSIIRAITSDFFCGESVSAYKTLFVVGDIKQSIYSFQGARPDEFIRNKKFFIQKAKESNMVMHVINSHDCYRCDKSVIDMVNKFLENDIIRNAVTLSSDHIQQKSLSGFDGLVKLEKIATQYVNDSLSNIWHVESSDSIKILMDKIASDVKNYILNGSVCFDTNQCRSPEYRDVLILVRKRGKYTDALMSSLNRYSIPYSLLYETNFKDNMPINDLLNLSYMCLNPSDNLLLCIVLKSPLFCYSEKDLMALQNINFDLLQYNNNDYNTILQLRMLANSISSYDFFCKLLFDFDLINKLVKCFGNEIYGIIDKFLEIVSNLEKEGIITLSNLMSFIDNNNLKINKFTLDNRVKISTVHNAKGREASLVIIIPEGVAGYINNKPVRIYDGIPVVTYGLSNIIKNIKDKFINLDIEEDLRLLYVALTRAKNDLRIYALDCNNIRKNTIKKNWFEWLSCI